MGFPVFEPHTAIGNFYRHKWQQKSAKPAICGLQDWLDSAAHAGSPALPEQ
jgi:hypothetical protein